MATYAVIMAGGIGSRFWPRSRRESPKQFLNVINDATLIQNTAARLQGLIPPENWYVVTHERYVDQTREQLPAIPLENILAEPVSRNTAPCIAYAAHRLLARDPDATMIVLPADHIIQNVAAFHDVLHTAIEAAQDCRALITIGITPEYPATGYGYIQFDQNPEHLNAPPVALNVRTFAEKPDLTTAERFLDSGDFLWNSGIFIWRADSILDQMKEHLPEAIRAFAPLADALGTEHEQAVVLQGFKDAPRISIDHGVMEHADKVYVIPASLGWSDVGDWRAAYDLSEKDEVGNSLKGNVLVVDSSRCLVQSDKRLVALIGMHDAVVVDTDDALLICNRENAQRVKEIVDYLYNHQWNKYV